MSRSSTGKTWSTGEAHQTKLTSEMVQNPMDATELFGGERERFRVSSDATPIMCSALFVSLLSLGRARSFVRVRFGGRVVLALKALRAHTLLRPVVEARELRMLAVRSTETTPPRRAHAPLTPFLCRCGDSQLPAQPALFFSLAILTVFFTNFNMNN